MIYRLPPWREVESYSTLEQLLDWGLSLIGAAAAWARTRGAYQAADGTTKRVKVLVIDTGIQVDPMTGRCNHPDLVGSFVSGRDFTDSPHGIGDRHGHGTATAALIAAKNNDQGICGVASDCEVYIAKGLGDDGSGDNATIAQAVLWGDQLDVDIISFSGGSPLPDPELAEAINTFLDRRTQRFFIAAAGNDGTPNSVNYPASDPRVLGVGAVDKDGNTAKFSSRGEQIDCAGPGVGVKSCNNRSNYGTYNGTSFACPLVAGVVALMLAWYRDARNKPRYKLETFDHLLDRIKAASINQANDPEGQGWGILNADKATEIASVDDDEQPIMQIKVGPFLWTMPARKNDLAGIGFADDATPDQRKQAGRALQQMLSGIAQVGQEVK